jgi:hypothetical protein
MAGNCRPEKALARVAEFGLALTATPMVTHLKKINDI